MNKNNNYYSIVNNKIVINKKSGFNTITKVKPPLTKQQTFNKLDEFNFQYIEQYVREKKLKNLNG